MRDPSRQVVVTGTGLCCHMGDDTQAILALLREGRVKPVSTWPPAVEMGARCRILGLYPGDLSPEALDVDKAMARFMGRASLLALRAARAALEEARLTARDIGLIVGSGTADVLTHIDTQARLAKPGGARRVPPTIIPRLMISSVSANLANVLGTTGPSFTITAACAGGAYNILVAAEFIEQGHIDQALCGGAEIASTHFHAGFDSMRAYNTQDNDHPERASRPYAADRAGFIFSEGAGMLVLETRASAEKRGVPILGILRGYGMSSDGQHKMVQPSSEGAEACMRHALDHAELDPGDIDYVNTHGTSTPLGDISEVRALRRLFGDRPLAYSSTKCYTGHTISAAGAIEAIFTLAMLREGWIAPAANATPLDPELEDYPPVLTPTSRSMKFALSNSFGFGGTNVSLVLERPD